MATVGPSFSSSYFVLVLFLGRSHLDRNTISSLVPLSRICSPPTMVDSIATPRREVVVNNTTFTYLGLGKGKFKAFGFALDKNPDVSQPHPLYYWRAQ